jgi:hypothetical protein
VYASPVAQLTTFSALEHASPERVRLRAWSHHHFLPRPRLRVKQGVPVCTGRARGLLYEVRVKQGVS